MANALEKLFGKKGSRRTTLLCAAVLLALFACLLWKLPALGDAAGQVAAAFRLPFPRRALLAGVPVALCAALLGVILVLKRYSMIGDGLSHVGFGSLTVAVALGAVTMQSLPDFLPEGVRRLIAGACSAISAEPMAFTLVVVVVCATLLLRLSRSSALQGDSVIALISTSALALGVVVAHSVKGMNIDVENYMFGSILAMTVSDVYFSIALSVAVLTLFAVFYQRIFAVTFDESFARATGMNTSLYNLLIAVLTAMTIVLGMRMMGTMLISSLIIFPALTSMRVYSRFRAVLICSAVVSVACFVLGVLLSCITPVPVGAGIVGVNLAVFVIFSLIGAMRG